MRRIYLIPIIILGLALLAGGVWYFFLRENGAPADQNSAAIAAGKNLTGNRCAGEGPGTLTNLPMDLEDFAFIIPYGLMVGDHVTPIDHQYYSPTVFNSPRDTYPVYAMADARLVNIEPRDTERGREYRLVFTMTCTFLYYYDLVTSLAPDVQAAYDSRRMDLEVQAGQLIGRIGGQTLDFAVWDTTKPLTGFVNPASYDGEAWKIYTADPLDYATDEIKHKMFSKYIRTAEPHSGKIDHDIDGRLVGNWFLEGTNGYAGKVGTQGPTYATGHLSIAPDHIDPTAFMASFGSYQGEPKQFSLSRSAPNPAEVAVSTGLVKYNLLPWNWQDGKGKEWDRFSFPSLPLTLINEGYITQGCVLFQLLEDRRLKMETFPGKSCSQVKTFTPAAKFYER
ncbi:MAG: hypothetical protein WD940_02135 [Patescibacteria group bacterium]